MGFCFFYKCNLDARVALVALVARPALGDEAAHVALDDDGRLEAQGLDARALPCAGLGLQPRPLDGLGPGLGLGGGLGVVPALGGCIYSFFAPKK